MRWEDMVTSCFQVFHICIMGWDCVPMCANLFIYFKKKKTSLVALLWVAVCGCVCPKND